MQRRTPAIVGPSSKQVTQVDEKCSIFGNDTPPHIVSIEQLEARHALGKQHRHNAVIGVGPHPELPGNDRLPSRKCIVIRPQQIRRVIGIRCETPIWQSERSSEDVGQGVCDVTDSFEIAHHRGTKPEDLGPDIASKTALVGEAMYVVIWNRVRSDIERFEEIREPATAQGIGEGLRARWRVTAIDTRSRWEERELFFEWASEKATKRITGVDKNLFGHAVANDLEEPDVACRLIHSSRELRRFGSARIPSGEVDEWNLDAAHRVSGLHPTEVVVDTDDVVFAEVITVLYLDEDQIISAGVLDPVRHALDDIDR